MGEGDRGGCTQRLHWALKSVCGQGSGFVSGGEKGCSDLRCSDVEESECAGFYLRFGDGLYRRDGCDLCLDGSRVSIEVTQRFLKLPDHLDDVQVQFWSDRGEFCCLLSGLRWMEQS